MRYLRTEIKLPFRGDDSAADRGVSNSEAKSLQEGHEKRQRDFS